MAFMNQEKKKEIAKLLKEELKNYKIKYSLCVDNYSSINLSIMQSDVDFIKNYNENNERQTDKKHIQINNFYLSRSFTGKALEILEKINKCLNYNNYDKSDAMTDYFDVGHYVNIHIGKWDKDFILI